MIKRTVKEEREYQKILNHKGRKYAIKAYCYECSAYQKSEVRKCPVKECPLWKYRTGKEEK